MLLRCTYLGVSLMGVLKVLYYGILKPRPSYFVVEGLVFVLLRCIYLGVSLRCVLKVLHYGILKSRPSYFVVEGWCLCCYDAFT